MPALVNSSVGSLPGTSGDDATRLWPISSKKSRNASRTSALVIFFMGNCALCGGYRLLEYGDYKEGRGRWQSSAVRPGE
jgi:hypothetical protein